MSLASASVSTTPLVTGVDGLDISWPQNFMEVTGSMATTVAPTNSGSVAEESGATFEFGPENAVATVGYDCWSRRGCRARAAAARACAAGGGGVLPRAACAAVEQRSEVVAIACADSGDAAAFALALELLYTGAYADRLASTPLAAALVRAFHFLGAEAGIEAACRYLARECIRNNDMASLANLKDAYPLSSFFSDATGVLSSNMTSPSRDTAATSTPNPTNSMTIEDLGVLIAKSSTKTGFKYLPFVQTELHENERLHFTMSNGFALIQELHRERLVLEAQSDQDRLAEIEHQMDNEDDEDDDESDDDDWEDNDRTAAHQQQQQQQQQQNPEIPVADGTEAGTPPIQNLQAPHCSTAKQ
ncbi:hypothetical protein BDR26DRAFT_949573 [Obelidium mucronatum]|nr:hypothetical protein BDR26DRAFT_949573 [Obelidium mucronatum]